jgi:CO/xanthine dehydrogenase Mo-binding subunit
VTVAPPGIAPDLKIVGQPVARHDAVEKVQGRTAYAADFELPGMLAVVLVRSPYPSARIRSVSVERARALPGVACVLLADDVPNNTTWVDVPGQTVRVGQLRARLDVLARERVRFAGEPLAIVAAETAELARQARDLVDVEYEPLDGVFDPAAALEPDAPPVHDEGDNLLAEWHVEDGDVQAALGDAEVIVERTYRTQFVDHAYLETESGVSWLDADGVVTIRVSTQVIEHARDVANILGLPHSKVRVIAPYVGGGFGGKEDVTVEAYLGLVTLRTGRPAKIVWTRQESLLVRPKRHPFIMRYRTGATRDGRIVAQDVELLADSGAYAYLSALVLMYASVCAAGPYAVPNVRVRARAAYTNNPPTSAFRGFGGMQVTFGYESQLDLVACELALDPLELRRRNFLKRGDTLPVGQRLETVVAVRECLERVWEALGEPTEPSGPRRRVGRGLACNLQPYGRIIWLNDWSSAWVGFEMDGTLRIRIGVPDVGGGQASSLCQIAAEVAGVPLERVTIHIGDSALTPLTGTTTATRQLLMSGNAVLTAARQVRQNLLEVAAPLLGSAPDRLDLRDGAAVAEDGRSVPITEVIQACARAGVAWQHLAVFHAPGGEPVQAHGGKGRVFPDYTFGAHAAEVEVDLDTGQVRVLTYAASHDVGRAINPQSVEGQIEGAVAQGIGFALSEDVTLVDGVNMATSFAGYVIPDALTTPDIRTIVLESGEGLGPFGARGIGEPPIGPPAPALANAIHDAVGVRLTELPMTPERVLRGLGTIVE